MNRNIITSEDVKLARSIPDDFNVKEIPSDYDLNKLAKVGIIQDVNLAPELIKKNLEEIKNASPDGYLTKLLKYVPTEIIVLYLSIKTWVSALPDKEIIYWFLFFFGVIITPIYLWRVVNVEKKSQLLLSTVSFCVWAFAIGEPFSSMNWYNAAYASILISLYTFLLPVFKVSGK